MHKSVTIQDVYEALKRVEEKMVTREDIEALVDSVEILSNPKTMEALHKSDLDIKAGRVKYNVPKQKSYKIENPFSMWRWINARKLHPLCKGIDI